MLPNQQSEIFAVCLIQPLAHGLHAAGDPGSTRYFLSLEDNLFRIFGGNRIQNLMSAFRVDDLPIESDMLTKSLNEAQRKVLIPHRLSFSAALQRSV